MFNDKEWAVNRMHQLSCQVLFDSFLDTFVTWLQFNILKSCDTVQIVSLGMVSVGGKNWMNRKRSKTVTLMSENQTWRPLCIPQKQIQNYFLVVWILLAREFYMTRKKKKTEESKQQRRKRTLFVQKMVDKSTENMLTVKNGP